MLNTIAGRIRRATFSGDKKPPGDEPFIPRRLTDADVSAVSAPTTPGTLTAPDGYFPPPPVEEIVPTLTSAKATVHSLYDIYDPPAQPPGTTRFVCISDTHSQTFNVPDGDVLLHSGDLSSYGRQADLEVTLNWLASLPHKIKMSVAGSFP